jgi:hypothetical protein
MVGAVAGSKPDYRTRTATVSGTGRVRTVMDGFRSVAVGSSRVREGKHSIEGCVERRRRWKMEGKKMRLKVGCRTRVIVNC